jgi:hypothetical protein
MKICIENTRKGMTLTDGRVIDTIELGTSGGGIIDFTNGDWEAYWADELIDIRG